MIFDPSVSIGTILNALALLIGFTVAFTKIGGRIDLLSQRLGTVEEVLKSTAAISNQIASLQERLNAAQRDIGDLRNLKRSTPN